LYPVKKKHNTSNKILLLILSIEETMRFYWILAFFYPLLLASQPEKASDVYGEGVRAYYAQDYATAIKKYSEALALKPHTEGYLYSRGLTYMKMDLDTLAAADFKALVGLDSNYIDGWYELGMIRMGQKQYDTAFAIFNRAIRINRSDTRLLHQIGLLYYYQRENGQAIGVYNRIIDLDPDDGQAYYKRGLVEFNMEDFDNAIEDFSQTYKMDPDNTLALEQRAISYLRLNDLDNACKDWMILLKKGNPRAKDNITLYCGKN
jgi:tetratricopeptide (TPR) repeat protein